MTLEKEKGKMPKFATRLLPTNMALFLLMFSMLALVVRGQRGSFYAKCRMDEFTCRAVDFIRSEVHIEELMPGNSRLGKFSSTSF